MLRACIAAECRQKRKEDVAALEKCTKSGVLKPAPAMIPPSAGAVGAGNPLELIKMLNVAKTVICMQRIEAVPDEVIHSGSHPRQSGEPRVRVPHRREQGGWLHCLERSVISATSFIAPSDGRNGRRIDSTDGRGCAVDRQQPRR